jgi:hypothetical protein
MSETVARMETDEDDKSPSLEPVVENKKEQAPNQNQANAMNEDKRSSFTIPRDYVILPTLGKLYPENHPLRNKENVEVRHLTAADEDILTSRSLLRSGKALDVLLQNCIVNKNIDINQLISGDKNSIMTFLRISGYGPEYEVQIDCPGCEEEVQYMFNLSQLPVRTLDLEPSRENDPYFSLTLPSGTVIEFKFLTSAEESEIAEMLELVKRKTNSPLERNITTRYAKQIVSVNGDENSETINEFARYMPVNDSRYFRKFLSDNEPDVIMKQDFVCPLCNHKEEIDIPIGIGFFWPE